jgi:hypothetical protein
MAEDVGTCICATWSIADGREAPAADAQAAPGSPAGALVDELHAVERGIDAAFAASLPQSPTLQGWIADTAWIPAFASAEDWAPTPYEVVAGMWSSDAAACMRADWCARHLRMMARELWLGEALAQRVDIAALREVADVAREHDLTRVTLKPGLGLGAVEAALAAIWPPPPGPR